MIEDNTKENNCIVLKIYKVIQMRDAYSITHIEQRRGRWEKEEAL
jgi:hypothetical protein